MTETLIIRNFGPIGDKGITLDLRKVNVFIGDQGTGKSTVAKLYLAINHFFRLQLFGFDSGSNLEIPIEVKAFIKHLEIYEIDIYLTDDSFIHYKNEELEFTIDKFDYVSNFKKRYTVEELNNWNPTYITADRSMVGTLSNVLNALVLSKLPLAISDIYLRFANLIDVVKKQSKNKIYKFSNILGVDYEHKEGNDYIILKQKKYIDFSLSSSGIQSSVPLLLAYEKATSNKTKNNNTSLENNLSNIVIEEPELNLFPNTQKKLLEHIIANNFEVFEVDSKKEKYFKNQLIITTHSPYILTSLNNLMYAYQVGQKHQKEVSDIIPEKYWVNPEDVACYLMENGEAKSIIDEDGLIDATYIDGVSNELNNEYLRINEVKLDDELGVN